MYTVNNLDDFKSFVEKFLQTIKQKETALIIALSGNLGAGKTTLVQFAAEYFNITENITSPTFVIQKEYEIEYHHFLKKMIHVDAYRLENASELEYLGWDENINNPDNIIFIEWPEQVSGINMPNVTTINIKILENDIREIEIIS